MRSVVYYTDHCLPTMLAGLCQEQLQRAANAEIVAVGLNRLAWFGDKNIFFPGERGILTMHKQILAGLEAAQGDIVFLCEHDVFYSPSHFEFSPPDENTFCYNTNVLHVRWPDGYAVAWDDCQQVSGLCASRELLLDYYRQRIAQIERDGFNRHYEPGLKQTVGGQRVENWKSEHPNLDIRHGGNLTPSKWSPDDFRNAKYAKGWREMPQAPDWDAIVAG